MILAKNNILVKIEASKTPEYAILNPISGSFDIMNENEHNMLLDLENEIDVNSEFKDYMVERGYVYNSLVDETKVIDSAFKAFNQEIDNSMVQLMLVPTYSCNLACTYCFQHGIDGRPTLISKEIVDAFFDHARKRFKGGTQKPFITLFGGEPLINSPAQREIIEYIVDKCVEDDYELSAVTNGYDFAEYVDILKRAKIKEIQFTLDGYKEVHDSRRATANKKGTFDKIVAGMEAAVNNKFPVNLRSVVDTKNIKDMVNLAEFLDSKGWLDLPPELFKTHIGRNYELFECYAKPQHLMTQITLWGEFALMSKQYPVLSKFHRPDFKGIRHLVDTGEMYMATFDTCPAATTEWVFDLNGDIYGCTASCGREEYLLGKFWPRVDLNNKAIETWQNRNVSTIPKCKNCSYDALCGGGCGVVAANHNNGEILSPDCRPIQELLDLGVNYYIDEIKAMEEEVEEVELIESPELKSENSSCCSCEPDEIKSGCVICEGKLIYTPETLTLEKCMICGSIIETNVKCVNDHFVCDKCHSSEILGVVEQILLESSLQDPIKLAEKIFELANLNMHGPEYHSIVPAVLVTAYQNKTGNRQVSKIKEAIRRGKDTKGGSCGFNGSCGAAVGTGTAVSIIEGVTPMSKAQRSNANLATGYALIEISKHGGPRCCKRDSITSIESFINTTKYFNDMEKTNYICKQYKNNKDCIGIKCPYLPKKNML
ncbi:DUF5714 domain-containing protein [Clostridium sp.]|uniref:DUF5714 domain-containing protein n=1 Tax=Clostridium sp. TaxID=1506 RepID=UPI001A4797B5|nr:DUF5714 domain-containing protein [Clostridium sp.]MBK5234967.1 radical SAM protein [Clostridium sp.]